MKPRCKQALAIYRDVLHCDNQALSQVVQRYFYEHSQLTGSAGTSFGIEACYDHVNIFKRAFPDLTIIDVEAAATTQHGIVMPWKAVGTHEGYFLDIAPTHQVVRYQGYTSLFISDDWKINKWDYQIDLSAICKQLKPQISTRDALILHLQCLDADQPILTPKETICLAFLCQGLSSKYIAQQLQCSYKTIECHTQAIKAKLGCYYKEQLIDVIRDKKLYFLFRELFDMLFHKAS